VGLALPARRLRDFQRERGERERGLTRKRGGVQTHEDLPDLTGKTAMVTGAGGGNIGAATAGRLARLGATVVVPCRTLERAEALRREIVEAAPVEERAQVAARVVPAEMNLASLESVARFVAVFRASGRPLHSLVLCAAAVPRGFELTRDGVELTFGVAHVAHFALATALADVLAASRPSTVVLVSSVAHYKSVPPHFPSDLTGLNDRTMPQFARYVRAKLANVLFAKELARRLRGAGVLVNVAYPGVVLTRLAEDVWSREWYWPLARRLMWSPDTASLTVLAAAIGPATLAGGVTGSDFCPVGRRHCASDAAQDPALARELWDSTVHLLRASESSAWAWWPEGAARLLGLPAAGAYGLPTT